MPFTHKVLLEEQSFLDIIDQMRIAIPEEIRQAKRVTEERERIVGQAQTEAEHTLDAARQQAVLMLDERSLTHAARVQSEEILDEAQARAAKMKADADNYCIGVLSDLEAELTRLLSTARNGVQHLESNRHEQKEEH